MLEGAFFMFIFSLYFYIYFFICMQSCRASRTVRSSDTFSATLPGLTIDIVQTILIASQSFCTACLDSKYLKMNFALYNITFIAEF